MAPARIEQRESPKDVKAPWVCRNIEARRLDSARPALERLRMTKGSGAPDRTSTLEAEDPEFLSGSGCAYRLDAVLVGQGPARTLRALLHLHGPLLCRPLEALGLHRAAVGSRHHRPRRADPDAGAGDPGISRNRR